MTNSKKQCISSSILRRYPGCYSLDSPCYPRKGAKSPEITRKKPGQILIETGETYNEETARALADNLTNTFIALSKQNITIYVI